MDKIKVTCTADTLREAKALNEKVTQRLTGVGLEVVRIRAAEANGKPNITTTYAEVK